MTVIDTDDKEEIKVLRTGTPDEKARVLYFVAATIAPDVALLAAVEALLDDRSICQMYIPYRYGQLRSMAADVLTKLRAKVDDPRPVFLTAVPRMLSSAQLAELRHKAGIENPYLGACESYCDLLARGLVPVQDEIYDPAEYPR